MDQDGDVPAAHEPVLAGPSRADGASAAGDRARAWSHRLAPGSMDAVRSVIVS